MLNQTNSRGGAMTGLHRVVEIVPRNAPYANGQNQNDTINA